MLKQQPLTKARALLSFNLLSALYIPPTPKNEEPKEKPVEKKKALAIGPHPSLLTKESPFSSSTTKEASGDSFFLANEEKYSNFTSESFFSLKMEGSKFTYTRREWGRKPKKKLLTYHDLRV